MLIVLSPAKTLDITTTPSTEIFTYPVFAVESEKIIKKLKTLTPRKISQLMEISEALGQLNYKRYQNWMLPFTPKNSKQAMFVFNGDAYKGLNASEFSVEEIIFAQNHLRILSGLYGILRPLDLIQPYRLEMGIPFSVGRKKDLYSFWGDRITKITEEAVKNSGSDYLINLASDEYFKSIHVRRIGVPVITPEFKDLSGGTYKMISIFAKRARGLMSRFIIENRLSEPEDLKAFNSEGYNFNPRLSSNLKLVFTRERFSNL